MVILFTSSESEHWHAIFTLWQTVPSPSRVLDLIQPGMPLPVCVRVNCRVCTDQCSANRLLMLERLGNLSVLALACVCLCVCVCVCFFWARMKSPPLNKLEWCSVKHMSPPRALNSIKQHQIHTFLFLHQVP